MNLLRWVPVLAVTTSVFLAAAGPLQAQVINRENEIKAKYLRYFGYYVRWPGKHSVSVELQKEFVIGVVGEVVDDPNAEFMQELNEAAKKDLRVKVNKEFKNRPITIRKFANVQKFERTDDKFCHVLFFTSGVEVNEINQAKDLIEDLPVLLVSETPGLARINVTHIDLIPDKNLNRVTMKINKAHAEESKLQISSNLLRLNVVSVVSN